jgi:hypothetical protein
MRRRTISVATPDTIANPPTIRTNLDADGTARAKIIRATPNATLMNGP